MLLSESVLEVCVSTFHRGEVKEVSGSVEFVIELLGSRQLQLVLHGTGVTHA